MDIYCRTALEKARNRQVLEGVRDLLHLSRWEDAYHDHGERNCGIMGYLWEVVINPIITSMSRECIFLSPIICTGLYCRHGCCRRAGPAFMFQIPVTPSAVGCQTLACELWNFCQDTTNISGVIPWVSVLAAGAAHTCTDPSVPTAVGAVT